MDLTTFAERISALTGVLSGVSPDDPNAAQLLDEQAPVDGDLVRGIVDDALAGASDGWLLPKEQGGIRFGRVAKDVDGFSVDAVQMASPGPGHRHPRGEINLLIPLEGTPEFDGHAPGWVVYPSGSAHVPTVSGGSMLILYFLPGGEIEWLTGS